MYHKELGNEVEKSEWYQVAHHIAHGINQLIYTHGAVLNLVGYGTSILPDVSSETQFPIFYCNMNKNVLNTA